MFSLMAAWMATLAAAALVEAERPSQLFRVGDYVGPGSFWAESELVARRYGTTGTLQIRPTPTERVLVLGRQSDAIALLALLGYTEDEAYRLLEEGNDWMMAPALLTKLTPHFDWVRQRIEWDAPEWEWIRLTDTAQLEEF